MVSHIQLLDIMSTEKNQHYQIIYNACSNNLMTDPQALNVMHIIASGLPRYIARTAMLVSRLTPNDPYMGRTVPLTSKRCILYIYSTNTGNEYFKHALYSPFFSLQNAVCFIMLTCLFPVLFTFYIQNVLKLKK